MCGTAKGHAGCTSGSLGSLQLTAKHRVARPVNGQHEEDVVIAGSVSNDEAKRILGEWKEPKPFIRIVPLPT